MGTRPTARGATALAAAVLLLSGLAPCADAATGYEPVLEWTGPFFRVAGAPSVDQLADSPPPAHGTPFASPQGVAAREHGAGERDVVYVLDTGNSRVQAFEANAVADRVERSGLVWRAGGVTPAAGEYDDDQILLPAWRGSADRWVLPYSERVTIGGAEWNRVADLSGFTAADHVYTVDYGDVTDAPELRFPTGSLDGASVLRIDYVISDNQGATLDAFGVGDVDYGVSSAAPKTLVLIDQSSGGPASWQQVRGLALIEADDDPTSDDLFLCDAADDATGSPEELFHFNVSAAGDVAWREAYTDSLSGPWDVAVARSGASEPARVTVSADTGPFDKATPDIRDAGQITGHAYAVTVGAGDEVTITDQTTGRVLLADAAFASLADPFYAIPGIALRVNPAAGGAITIGTVRPAARRYLFVADTGRDRIKVIAAHGAVPTATNDWLPSDPHLSAVQPELAIGGTPDKDYQEATPAVVPQGWSAWTVTFPIAEGTLDSLVLDPAGTPRVWRRVDDLSSAGPADSVYALDWTSGRILFGDGAHGAIPPPGVAVSCPYATSPDALRSGVSGDGPGEFDGPKGIAARWNPALGAYDVYVADTGNHRIQKFAFHPEDPALHLPPRLTYVTEWTAAASAADTLASPVDVAVAADGADPASVWIAVADQGNDRIVLYRDTAAASGGGDAAPSFAQTCGGPGAELGGFGELHGLAFLPCGDALDLYAVDRTRGVVVKWQRAPTPSIRLNLEGASALPASFPPGGSYRFDLVVENAPDGAWVDLYFDTAATFNPATADLCFPAGTVPAATGTVSWRFGQSPGPDPVVGQSYYLFARLQDAEEGTVASAQTSAEQRLTIDGSIVPRVQSADAIDGDRTLYLQNGGGGLIELQVAWPESVVAVGFSGTFNPALLEITGITEGEGWAGIGGLGTIFNASYDNAHGRFLVSTAVQNSPFGLNGSGPFPLARVAVRAKENALAPTPLTARYEHASISLSKADGGITMVEGSEPTSWQTRSLNLRLGYLGDLADADAGADSALPHLAPRPDGRIGFADQMTFTLGWNGKDNVRDRISDLGPAAGTVPDLRAQPDGRVDVEDLLVFTTMFSWANAEGFGKDRREEPDPALVLLPPAAGGPRALAAWRRTDVGPGHGLEIELAVEEVVDLTGARLRLAYDPARLEPAAIEEGDFLPGEDGSLFLTRREPDALEICATRLDRRRPGVSGSGVIARVAFLPRAAGASPLRLDYDLRSADGSVLARGVWTAGADPVELDGFRLDTAWANPAREATSLYFALDRGGPAALEIFDASGRRVRSLLREPLPAGGHVVVFDGRDEAGTRLPSGVYFCRLASGGREAGRKFLLAR